MTTNLKIAKASAVLMLAGVLGHAVGLVKEILTAHYFGITPAMDAFYAAMSVPGMFSGIILSTFSAVFIPIFTKLRMKNKDEAFRYSSVVINYLLIFSFIVSSLIFIFALPIIRACFPGLAGEAVGAAAILKVVSFSVFLTALVGCLSGLLNASEHFAAPAYSMILISATTIFLLVFFVGNIGVFAVAYGLMSGLFLQCVILIRSAKNIGFKHTFVAKGLPETKETLKLSLIYCLAIAGAQLNLVTDRIMAGYIPSSGNLSALGYASKLISAPLSVFSASLATSAFPFVAVLVHEKKISELKETLTKLVRGSLFIFLPMITFIIIFARPAVEIIFQRGRFDAAATALTSDITIYYAPYLLFFTVSLIFARVFLAIQDVVVLVKLVFFGVAANIALNFIFMRLIDPPIAGIALATSVVYFLTVALEFFLLKKRNIGVDVALLLKSFVVIAGASLIMAIFAAATFGFMAGARPVVRLGSSAAAAAAVFYLASSLFGISEIKIFGNLLKRDRAA